MAVRGHANAELDGDIQVDDRLRYMANMPGRYFLEKWRGTGEQQVMSLSCRILRISPRMIGLSAPVGGDVGDKVTAHFDTFGVLRGHIVRSLGFGFVFALRLSDGERAQLAARISWLERRRNFEVAELRRHERIIPRNPHSALIFADGSRLACLVLDMSSSGAAISASVQPAIGTPVALGSVVGRVVRHLPRGFAIEFIEAVNHDALETRLLKPENGPGFADCPDAAS